MTKDGGERVHIGLSISAETHKLIKTYAALKEERIKDVVRRCIEGHDWKKEVMQTMGGVKE